MIINGEEHKDSRPPIAPSIFPWSSGFLVVGLLWGFAIGYVVADWSSKSIGYDWYWNPYPRYFAHSIRCLLIGPVAGLICGLALDLLVSNNLLRQKLLKYSSVLLVFAAVVYFLFVAPAIMTVRE